MYIPSLIVCAWTFMISFKSQYSLLNHLVDAYYLSTTYRLSLEGARLHKMEAADVGLFAASWWPYASYEALNIAAYLSLWVCLQAITLLAQLLT